MSLLAATASLLEPLFAPALPDELMWIGRGDLPFAPSFRFGPRELAWLLLTLAIVYISTRRRRDVRHLSRRPSPDGGVEGGSPPAAGAP